MEHEERLKAALADRYRIEREIGSGGMATVYLAQDLRHERQVAVKVFNPELAATLGAERFLREIKTAAKLTHPNILPVHDSGEAEGFLFYVMPYVKGESLRSRLTKEKQLPVEDAVQITREIADALAYAHGEGVIHRDVKPANIMLEAGHAVLADFGVAHAVAEAKDERITRTGTSLGTPAYMSPEQATGEQDLDGRSDQYALGCVLYEMLAGHPPFAGAQVEAVLRQHLTAEPPSVAQERPTVPLEVSEVIHRSLAKSPADRFRTTGEMAAALALTTGPPRKEPKRFSRIVGGALAVAVVIVAVGVALVVRGRGKDMEPPSFAILPPLASGAMEDADFAYGVADAVYMRLQPVSGLTVKALYGPEQYDRRGKAYRQMGEDLGAEYLLDLRASQEEDPDRGRVVHINANLIRASDEQSIWGETYEEALESVFALHRSIAESVVQGLDLQLAAPEREALEANRTDNPTAWEYFQQAERLWRMGTARANNLQAVAFLERATAEDSTFALAYAYLALALPYTSVEEPMRRAQQALTRARQLDPDMPENRLAQANIDYAEGRYDQASTEYRAYLQGRPSDSGALLWLGLTQRRMGRWGEALETLDRAQEIDPLYPNLLENLAYTHLRLRNFTEAESYLNRWAEVGSEDDLRMIAFYQAWLRLVSRWDVAGAERILRQAVAEFGLEAVLGGLVDSDYSWYWFDLPEWGFREELRNGAISANSANFYLARASADQAEGDYEGARAYYDSARVVLEAREELTPADHGRLGVAYAGLGRTAGAVREAEECARMHSISMDAYSGPIYLMFLARTLVMVGDYDRAVVVLDSLVTFPSEWSRTWLRLHPFFEPLQDHPGFQALINESPAGERD